MSQLSSTKSSSSLFCLIERGSKYKPQAFQHPLPSSGVTCLWLQLLWSLQPTCCASPSSPSAEVSVQAFRISETWLPVWELLCYFQDGLVSPVWLSCLLQRCCPWCWKSHSQAAEERLCNTACAHSYIQGASTPDKYTRNYTCSHPERASTTIEYSVVIPSILLPPELR